MRSHAQDGAGFPSNQHYFHFLFILNEPLRAPWFCFLEEGEQHGAGTGAASAAGPELSEAPELRGRAGAGRADGRVPPELLREPARESVMLWAAPRQPGCTGHARSGAGPAAETRCGRRGTAGSHSRGDARTAGRSAPLRGVLASAIWKLFLTEMRALRSAWSPDQGFAPEPA